MSNDEMDTAIATRAMGWKLVDRKAMGWGDGPAVYSTGRRGNPTEMFYSPSTDLRQARQAAKKAGVKIASTDPMATCLAVLEALDAPRVTGSGACKVAMGARRCAK
jgi:hypothetical protein